MVLVTAIVIMALQQGATVHESNRHEEDEARPVGVAVSNRNGNVRAASVESAAFVERRTGVLRSGEIWLNRLIDAGLRRSQTFATLTASIEAHRAIVYVESRDASRANFKGAVPTSVVRTPDGTRYLRVWVLRGRAPDDMIATIGHELQHVVELLEIDDGDVASGFPVTTTVAFDPRTGRRTYETDAAIQVGVAVRRELRAGRR